jgi:hypothetical protein
MQRLIWLVVLVLTVCSNIARADVIFESALLGPTGQEFGVALFDHQFLGARFSLTETFDVTAVGGHLEGDGLAGGLSVAIVQLASAGALPVGPAFTTPPLAGTSFLAPFTSADVMIPLSITLAPGHYGLIFTGGPESGSMPANDTDLPGASYFIWNGSAWEDGGFSGARFVVYGNAPAVPEPASLLLLATGMTLALRVRFPARRRGD